jgi:hypothetical protein
MQRDTAMLLDRWSRHPDHGVVALAHALPRAKMGTDGTIGPDEWDTPVTADLYCDQESAGVAAELDPPSVPAWCTWAEGEPVEVEVKERGGSRRAFAVIVGGGFVTAGDADAAAATRDADAYCRANRISFQRFNTQAVSAAYRELNDIHILKLEHIGSTNLPGLPVGSSKLWGINATRAIVVDRLS